MFGRLKRLESLITLFWGCLWRCSFERRRIRSWESTAGFTAVLSFSLELWRVSWTALGTNRHSLDFRLAASLLRAWTVFLRGRTDESSTNYPSLPSHSKQFWFPAISYVLSELVPRYGFIKAAQQLHLTFLINLLRLPMAFFDRTPIGRILSRCSKDIDVIDDRLPHNFDSLTFFTFQVMSMVADTKRGDELTFLSIAPNWSWVQHSKLIECLWSFHWIIQMRLDWDKVGFERCLDWGIESTISWE
jgi:hypothetical protein